LKIVGLSGNLACARYFEVEVMADYQAQPGSSLVPIVVALIVAVIGAAVLFHMDLVPRGAVRNDGINKISRAALARAGATETPTQPNR
jgi:hypothetical protein